MNKPVNLNELIQEMEHVEGYTAFLNKKTGEIITISDEALSAAEKEDEDEDEDGDGNFDVEAEDAKIATDILENEENYLELPSEFDISEYEMMEGFCLSLKDKRMSNTLLNLIKGKGAFRRFKDTVQEFEIQDDWYQFRDEAYKEKAIEWCNDNEVKFIDE